MPFVIIYTIINSDTVLETKYKTAPGPEPFCTALLPNPESRILNRETFDKEYFAFVRQKLFKQKTVLGELHSVNPITMVFVK